MIAKYNPREIERKWQARWDADGLYEVTEDPAKPKWYALTMFPYTSGDLHIGHWYAMAPSDVLARYMRMRGYNVLHPMGFDAFGLPAENAAIARGIHPFTWTLQNIENMRRQLRSLGAIYPWSREVITCLPEYYRWTQWFFLKLYEAGLAYRALAPANWCPGCQTVLANEQVVGGECERCGAPVSRRELPQWFFRITRYADELLNFSAIEWPERICTMQRNWIGRSEGAAIAFGIEGRPDAEIRVFTTRADTVYGVTFMVLAPENPLVAELTTPERRAAVEAYVAESRRLTEIERLSTTKEKTGVFIGAHAINRLNGDRVPIFIADYVLLSYGTGCVMGVPAHDTRDFDFARRYGLPIPVVVAPPGWDGGEIAEAYIESGTMVNSGPFSGMPSEPGMGAVAEHLRERGWGGPTVSYRLRDWLVSRQRYWGAPIPIVYCERCGTVPLPERDLPVLLPEDAAFRPTGESPLRYHAGFLHTTCPQCGGPAQRETDTLDTFVCSCWYLYRYASPHYGDGPFDPAQGRYWLPVDQYTGGAEHAVMHLLYARFFAKAMRDLGVIDFGEPFRRLYNQGIILGEDNEKMSKSRGNVVNPDDYVSTLGADTVRAYLMFIGPWEQGGSWNSRGIGGISRWLNRVWSLALEPSPAASTPSSADPPEAGALRRLTHQTIKRVAHDIERFRFNTMLAALMEFTNELTRLRATAAVDGDAWREAVDSLLLMLAPSVPHFAEELWERSGHAYSVHQQPFPTHDEALAAEETVEMVVQVNGRLRATLAVSVSIGEAEATALALANERVRAHVGERPIRRIVYVPRRLVNVVVE